ncbi:MAG: AmmeMemoRadiSam system radical SAM enzyme [Desulfobacula sp.]|nr:AmmeMemoRadiSam system radical SAM enzyme [Desulfobacula sp.]
METLIYQKDEANGKSSVRCMMCSHYCIIKKGKKGICRVRENSEGCLQSLTYPNVIAKSIDPIEKKPIFHLKPGSTSYSIASVGCNFKCTFCQNADIAQIGPDQFGPEQFESGRPMAPETIVEEARISGCKSISYTYTEPTVFFELAFETAQLAKEKGLFNVFVTNGYMSVEALDMLLPYISAANVDLKSFDDQFYKKYCKARLAPVKKSIEKMKKAGVLVELTTLLIPGLNDGENELAAMADYIANTLGKETPWHISRFHPCHKMTDRHPTPVSSLENAYNIGKAAGLWHVYIGNVPGTDYENTHCHSCGELLVKRFGYQTKILMQECDKCPKCGTRCFGVF